MEHKLIIHIGLRKTGSSALQEILAEESGSLLNHGICYPDRLTKFPAHQELAWSLLDSPPPELGALTLDVVYKKYNTIIESNAKNGIITLLSSEDLSLLSSEINLLIFIKNQFSKFFPKIVCYYRDPISYHISNYKHSLLFSRETRSFSEYIFNISNLYFSLPNSLERPWQGVFGKENVQTLLYKPSSFKDQSIYKHFCTNALEINIDNDQYCQFRSNTGVSSIYIDTMLQLNRSDLPYDEIKPLKHQMRDLNIPNPNEEKDFLERNLSTSEIKFIESLLT